MRIKILLSVFVLALALPAAAEFRTVKAAYEVRLTELRLPQNEAGTIAYKTCGECAFQTTRVSGETSWVLNGRSMSLAKFREGLANIEDRDNKYVTVMHHLESNRVTKVAISLR